MPLYRYQQKGIDIRCLYPLLSILNWIKLTIKIIDGIMKKNNREAYMKKIVACVLIFFILINLTSQSYAKDDYNGKYNAGEILQTYSLYDTYYIDNVSYQCLVKKDGSSRLYYNEKTETFVVDTNTLQKLEMIYMVNEKTGGIFSDYILKNDIIKIKKSVDSNNDIITQTLGWQIFADQMGGLFGNAITAKGDSFMDVCSTLFSEYEKHIADIEKEVKSLINHTITDSLTYSSSALSEAMGYYDKYSSNELKNFENAKKIILNYDFASTTFTNACHYIGKVYYPEVKKPLFGVGEKFLQAFAENALGAVPSVSIVYTADKIYTKQKALSDFLLKTKPTQDNIIAVRNVVRNVYNGTLTSSDKKFISVLCQYDTYFNEFYTGVKADKNKLIKQLSYTGFSSANAMFGSSPMYTPDDYVMKSIKLLTRNAVLRTDTLYAYKGRVTREEFSEYLYKLYMSLAPKQKTIEASDPFVDTDNPYAIALNKLGILNGKEKNKFYPEEEITREHACIAISKMLSLYDIKSPTSAKNIKFNDIKDIPKESLNHIKKVVSLGIMDDIKGNFKPNNTIELQDLVVVLANVINKLFVSDVVAYYQNSDEYNNGKEDYTITTFGTEGNSVWTKTWSTNEGSELPYGSDIVVDKSVMYFNLSQKLQAINLNTSEVLWKSEYGGSSRPLIIGSKIYVTSYYGGKLSCIDKKTGKLIWEKDPGDEYYWPGDPIEQNGNILVYYEENGGLIFDAKGNIIDEVKYQSEQPKTWDNVTASSSEVNCNPSNVIDDDYRTAWAEGAEGSGKGEWLYLENSVANIISEIKINNGNHKSENDYKNNGLVKSLKIEFSNGEYLIYNLNKKSYYSAYDTIKLAKLIDTTAIKFTIVDSYSGALSNNTYISDIKTY